MKIRPLYDRVLVKRIEADLVTSGGIIIPESAKEKPQQGIIVAAGPGKRDDAGAFIALDVKKGDKVLFGKYAGSEIKIDGVEHTILKEDEILGVLS
ncbi:MAG: co-chaperone GroES [Deltaproteobacteria bacterium CG2_30_63_29]|nr:MAG: co-chaperone GroES [Deltaproteobacteria bacterium CG2_30_63_29]PJB47610.1 MAG: co-chaperone GroES [Deltaproteobacteria bacterium CG_4_9_14_3_um_filter_63_12]